MIRASARCRRLRWLALPLCAAWLSSACGAPAGPETDWPAGALLIGRGEALSALLKRIATLEGTPLAGRAEAMARALPDCEIVEARAESGALSELWSRLTCKPERSQLEALDAVRGDRDLAFALPVSDGSRAWGTLAVGPRGEVEGDLRLPHAAVQGAAALLLPGREAPGPGVLSRDGELFHARARPDGGLDLASLVSPDGQAQRLFRLKSRLFGGAVLDGTWEAAVYLPGQDQPVPRAALAVGFSRRAPAVAAIEGFVSDLQSAWPVRRSFFAVDGAQGACLLDLNVLPAFAPCYVATDRALVVGWNPASVRQALGGTLGPASDPVASLLVDFERVAQADAMLARSAGGGEPALPRHYPWRRLTVRGETDREAVHLRATLEPGADG